MYNVTRIAKKAEGDKPPCCLVNFYNVVRVENGIKTNVVVLDKDGKPTINLTRKQLYDLIFEHFKLTNFSSLP